MFVLTCATREYAWGSTNHLPRFLGRPPTGAPQAELWIGAHEGDPSRLPDGRRLDEAVREDPVAMLGPHVASRFGPRLPYLVKALAAAEPLSLQVHPTSERARIGFEREEAAGIPLDAPTRSYLDQQHKPELVFALTRFEGMAGFRDVEKSAEILRLLGAPWADHLAQRLEAGPAVQALRAVTTDLLATSADRTEEVLRDIGRAAANAEAVRHREELRAGRPLRSRTNPVREGTRVFALTTQLAKRYPRDPGVLVTLLLNHVVLAPGEAMYLDAGVIHAYTSGFGVEVMASSDNVLRAGLTPKHVDVPELLDIASFTPIPPPLWEPTTTKEGLTFDPPVAEFTLRVFRTPCTDIPADGPRVVLVLDGSVELISSSGFLTLRQGQAVFVPHNEGPVRARGFGRVAVAAVP